MAKNIERNQHYAVRQSSYSYDDIIRCGKAQLFGEGNAQLPLPNMLMFDRITHVSDSDGAHGKGSICAELDIKKDLWFFGCHFEGDPVMPGCLGLDAMWQLLGFYLGWSGGIGKGRAIGLGELKFSGQITPANRLVQYKIDLKRVIMGRLIMGIADGILSVDGDDVYHASDMRVGLFTS